MQRRKSQVGECELARLLAALSLDLPDFGAADVPR